MTGPTRRAVWVSGLGLAALGCAGLPTASGGEASGSGRGRGSRVASGGDTRKPAGAAAKLFLPGETPGVGVRTQDIPAWQQRAAAVYLATPVTAGAASLCFADGARTTLPHQISHFRELPTLLERARELGSDIVYITDFYEGAPGSKPDKYWGYKESYVAREDLGGGKALADAADAIHAHGGRLVLYLCGFTLSRGSPIGRKHGEAWSVKRGGVAITEPYPGFYMPCPAAPGWVAHVVAITRRLAAEYHADGVHLDSFGNMHGYKCDDPAHGHALADGAVFNDGCRAIATQARAAMRESVPDAAVWCEGLKVGKLYGAVDASQCWGIHELAAGWPALRAGSVDVFTAGWSLDDNHQILALGHKWMLADWFRQAPRGTCVEALERALDSGRIAGDDRAKRYGAERGYRVLHQWRNAGLLAQLRVPDLELLTPRRWDRQDLFAGGEAEFQGHLGALKETARALDEAVPASAFVAPAAHLRALARAREKLSPILDGGATVERADLVDDVAVAWRFTGRNGVVATAVNVSDNEVELKLQGSYVDAVDGSACSGRITVAAHRVRLLIPS